MIFLLDCRCTEGKIEKTQERKGVEEEDRDIEPSRATDRPIDRERKRERVYLFVWAG